MRLAPGRSLLLGALTSLALLLALEAAIRGGLLPATSFPPLTDVGARLGGMLGEGAFWESIGATVRAWAVGLGLSALIAIPLGLLVGSAPWVYEWVRTTIEFLRPIPPVALIPLMILVFGPSHEMKVVLVVIAAVWPIMFQALYGVQDVDRVLRETAWSYRIPRLFAARHITLPSTLPYLFTGLRISAAIALIVAIAAELVSGAPGLGASIRRAQMSANATEAWALILVTGLLGVLINAVFRAGERRMLRWHPSQRLGA